MTSTNVLSNKAEHLCESLLSTLRKLQCEIEDAFQKKRKYMDDLNNFKSPRSFYFRGNTDDGCSIEITYNPFRYRNEHRVMCNISRNGMFMYWNGCDSVFAEDKYDVIGCPLKQETLEELKGIFHLR